jgi:Tfp pilus assembly protein FimT
MEMVRKMVNQKGVTLVDVVVVLGIISFFSAIGYPSFSNLTERIAFKAEVSNLVGWLKKAKSEAIKTNSFAVIEINPNGYKIFLDNSSTHEQAGDWQHQPTKRQLVDCRIKGGLSLSGSFPNNKIRFSSRPAMTGGTLIVSDIRGNRKNIIINTVGRIRVE